MGHPPQLIWHPMTSYSHIEINYVDSDSTLEKKQVRQNMFGLPQSDWKSALKIAGAKVKYKRQVTANPSQNDVQEDMILVNDKSLKILDMSESSSAGVQYRGNKHF
ncbi:hypothetical protein NPIL_504371 [Nephila pilipes]|uniref:Uncharacterized protein n=1 Tax=Nephila pilipes TaxID=299642 RepID=A0A8X6NVQ4_NEPPI|nr:hypothetical protein NPIL_504371 [Nephila pilipes]